MKNAFTVIPLFALIACADENPAPTGTPSDHADYVVIGKSVNTRQEWSGELKMLNTVFFAEIFQTKEAVAAGGTVMNGILTGPANAAKGLSFSDEEARYLTGGRTETIEQLDAIFPDATYHFSFDTPDGRIENMPATFTRDGDESLNPGPISLTLTQNGQIAYPKAIDPDQDLLVTWSPFAKGAADDDKIIDDMIYAMFGNCMGQETVHSGHAFDPGALTYRESGFTIPASALNPGQSHMLEVEHSNMETAVYEGIEIIVTYAASTFLDIQATGENTTNPECPVIPMAFDGGANDRIRGGQ
ncbi:hypothetical protein [Pseudemcibacter aquimaris]|uniref:hypothetical protein n=1 Tax=Pseudemcibacter aquimaris TaxID=2857064 RepID=UPI002011D4D0|nr:hypothetical protein [Pseudemcibacter aquimaris]MCC3859583.1 hypothetical protein [Pseudemcibacter aquimaris]WDU59979.1 hypothetical protein KW060_06880 [Pseudemcibacter aquimaris]